MMMTMTMTMTMTMMMMMMMMMALLSLNCFIYYSIAIPDINPLESLNEDLGIFILPLFTVIYQ